MAAVEREGAGVVFSGKRLGGLVIAWDVWGWVGGDVGEGDMGCVFTGRCIRIRIAHFVSVTVMVKLDIGKVKQDGGKGR